MLIRFNCFIFIILAGCSRSVENLNVSLSFSSLDESVFSVPSGYFPDYMIVNVHYDGQTSVKDWSCESPSGVCNSFPTNISFSEPFPSGFNRVIQALLVYVNGSGNMLFYYSHALNLSFVGGNLEVSLNQWQNSGVSEGMASVAGKIGGSGVLLGPTGKLVGNFEPIRPAGFTAEQIPAIKIFEEPIIGGWFNIQFLRGQRFTYSLYNSNNSFITNLFYQKNFEFFESQLVAGTNKMAAHVRMPDSYEVFVKNDSWVSYSRQKEEAIIGFFDLDGNIITSAANSHEVHYRLAGGLHDFNHAFRLPDANGNAINPLFPSGHPTYPNQWKNPANLLNPAVSQGEITTMTPSTDWTTNKLKWTDNTNFLPNMAQRIYEAATPDCNLSDSSNIFIDGGRLCIKPNFKSIINSIIPFKSVFQSIQYLGNDSYDFVTVDSYPAFERIKWQYLPDLVNTKVHGSKIYLVERESIDYKDVVCKSIINGDILSVEAADLVANVNEHEISHTELSNSGFVEPAAAICPYENTANGKKYFEQGIISHALYFEEVNSLNLSVSTTGSPGCFQLDVNFSRPDPTPINLTFTSSDSVAPAYYSGANCTGLIAATQTIDEAVTNQSVHTVFFTESRKGATHTINIIASGGSYQFDFSGTTNVNITTPVEISTVFPTSFSDECFGPINLNIPQQNAVALSCLVNSSNSNIEIHDDAACVSGNSSILAAADSSSLSAFYLKGVTAGLSDISFNCSGIEVFFNPTPVVSVEYIQ